MNESCREKILIKMVATDMDGTLLPHGHLLPARISEVLQKVLDTGVAIVPITGRTLASIPNEIKQLKGISHFITSNGATIIEADSGKAIYEKLLSPEVTAKILRIVEKYETFASVYQNQEEYNVDHVLEFLLKNYGETDLFFKNPQEDLAEFALKSSYGTSKIFVAVSDINKKEELMEELSIFSEVAVTHSSPWGMEINRKDVNKGRALKWLSKRMNIESKEILALGDNDNDITMFHYAGISAAPEDAKTEVKDIADYIFPACEEGGAADFLEQRIPTWFNIKALKPLKFSN